MTVTVRIRCLNESSSDQSASRSLAAGPDRERDCELRSTRKRFQKRQLGRREGEETVKDNMCGQFAGIRAREARRPQRHAARRERAFDMTEDAGQVVRYGACRRFVDQCGDGFEKSRVLRDRAKSLGPQFIDRLMN